MTERNDWDRWGATWRSPAAGPSTGAVTLASARARRALSRARLVETVVAVGAVAVLAGALLHAATAVEALSALGIGAVIMVVWLRRLTDRRVEARALASPPSEFDDIAPRLLRRQLALAQFAIIVVMLLLVFLVPWWVAGVREHSRADVALPVIVWTVWLPMTAMAVVVGWAIRLRGRAMRVLHALATP